MFKGIKRKLGVGGIIVVGFLLAACGNAAPAAIQSDQNTMAAALQQMTHSQPTPTFKWSQLREDEIEIETAQAQTVQTTSFFMNLGSQDPINSCPSIGFPVPATDQITNPHQIVYDQGSGGGGNQTIEQIDPNGVYGGDTTGTYVVCVNANGSPYFFYWEGHVGTVSGPAVWDYSKHQAKLTGPSTVNIKTQPNP